MLHEDDSFKQVEINTIAASFSGLSQKINGLHRYLVDSIPFLRDEFDSKKFFQKTIIEMQFRRQF